MSNSTETQVKTDEEIPLNTVAGSGEAENIEACSQVISSTGQAAAACCHDEHHRKLAVCSIICGISCIGIQALINSVKAEGATDPEAAAMFSGRAKKFGIIAIVTWVSILASIPLLMALVSFLLTLQD